MKIRAVKKSARFTIVLFTFVTEVVIEDQIFDPELLLALSCLLRSHRDSKVRIRGQFDRARLDQSTRSACRGQCVPPDEVIGVVIQCTDLLSIASLCHQGKSHGVWCRLVIAFSVLFGGGGGVPLAPPYG